MATKEDRKVIPSTLFSPQQGCNVKDLCRLCLISTDNRLEIFGKVGQLTDISGITNLFNFQILRNDSWPQSVCIECFQKLIDFHAFYSTVKLSEVTLMGLCGKWRPPEGNNETEMDKCCPVEEKLEPEDEEVENSDNMMEFPELSMEAPAEIKEEVEGNFDETLDFVDAEELPDNTQLSSEECVQKSQKRTREGRRIQREKRDAKKKLQDSEVVNYISLFCDLCSTSFVLFEDLTKHFANEHNQEGYVKCCDLILKTRPKLMEHLEYHKNPKKFQCKECGKCCKSYTKRSQHRMKHIPEEKKEHTCKYCAKKFVQLSILKSHEKMHLPHEYKCEQCTRTFATIHMLRSHIKINHENSQKKICEICAKVFNTSSSFKEHQKSHMDKNIECDVCGKMFNSRKGMLRHWRQHNQPKGCFACDICGKEFQRREYMKSHKNYAHKDKTFKCHLCEKEFRHSLNLKEHVATHTGQQLLYQCIFCEKKFNSNANKYVHQKRNHPNEWEEERKKKLEND